MHRFFVVIQAHQHLQGSGILNGTLAYRCIILFCRCRRHRQGSGILNGTLAYRCIILFCRCRRHRQGSGILNGPRSVPLHHLVYPNLLPVPKAPARVGNSQRDTKCPVATNIGLEMRKKFNDLMYQVPKPRFLKGLIFSTNAFFLRGLPRLFIKCTKRDLFFIDFGVLFPPPLPPRKLLFGLADQWVLVLFTDCLHFANTTKE